MDPIALGILVVIGVGLAWFFLFRSEPEVPEVKQAKDPVVTPAQVESFEKAVAKEKAKLPTNAELDKLTKAKLEELGREFGVELDKRKTKANMITDLKAGVKK